MPIQPTANYLNQTTAQTQSVVVVVQIAGVSDLLTSTHLETPYVYGDHLVYGQSGLTYGQLRDYGPEIGVAGYRDILDIAGSSLTISQKVEPEQGRASVSQLSLAFIDKDSYMTGLCAPGQAIAQVYGDGHLYGDGSSYGNYILSGASGNPSVRSGYSQSSYPPDILGSEVKVYIGYQGLAFPADYLQIFRGYVGQYSSQAGKVVLQLSDPNIKRRQALFQTQTTTLSAGINNAVTTIPLTSTGSAYQNIVGPDLSITDATNFYIQVDNEIISYNAVTSTQVSGGARAQLGTTADVHAADSPVNFIVEISDHAIDMALKLMLSGWNGPFSSAQPCTSIGTVTTTSIIFPANVDVKSTYGLVPGDWVNVTGSALGNNGDYQIAAIVDYNGTYNNRIEVLTPFPAPETGTLVLLAFRSQYDVYPLACGLQLEPKDVDIDQHLFLKTAFLGSDANSYRFVIQQEESSGKTFIESQIYLPFSMYSLTSRGRLSVNLTHPPIGGEVLYTFNQDNVLNPQSIQVIRGTNTRKFFNTIVYNFDIDLTGVYANVLISDDPSSVGQIGFSSTLPIDSNGARSGAPNHTELIFSNKADQLLSRYRYGAVQLSLTSNYGTGNLVEAGDVVAVQDGGQLQISNFTTGVRDLGTAFFEVEDRRFDIKSGRVTYSLISGVGGLVTDRFGLISPSSVLTSVTTTTVTLTPSFGNLYNEPRKWVPYIGQQVLIHNTDYTQSQEVKLMSQDQTDLNKFTVSPPLTITPLTGLIMDIATYPTSADPSVGQLYKIAYCYTDPQVAIATGISTTQFTVASGQETKFFEGAQVIVHTVEYATASPELTVTDVTGTTITLSASMGFVPTSAYFADLIGFANDSGAAYRYYTT